MNRKEAASRTRESVLDAAEGVFADKGYHAASIDEIAAAAGVSRGTPGAIFGSKENLYRAVLERAFAQIREELEPIYKREEGDLAEIVDAYLNLPPRLVRLIEWEALNGGAFLQDVEPRLALLEAARAGIANRLDRDGFRPVDPLLLLISIVGLCLVPREHRDTLVRGLGLDADDPDFLHAYKEHVVDLVCNGIRRREPGEPGDGTSGERARPQETAYRATR